MGKDRENEIDDALVRRMAEGDGEALRELIVRHQDRVYGTVARMIGGDEKQYARERRSIQLYTEAGWRK